MSWFKQPRVKDDKYLKWVGTKLPCLVTGLDHDLYNDNVAHHLLSTGLRGVGIKSPDNYVIPLSTAAHNELHRNGNEKKWLSSCGITNQVEIARRLYEIWIGKASDRDDKARTLILTRGESL